MTDTQSLLLFFIDGLGIGTRGQHNPFDGLTGAEPLAIFQNEKPNIPFEGLLARTDAQLGIEGRPQSASGQTTILTGVNAPANKSSAITLLRIPLSNDSAFATKTRLHSLWAHR